MHHHCHAQLCAMQPWKTTCLLPCTQALRLIRHLCNKGCSQFQKCMQRQSASVRSVLCSATRYPNTPCARLSRPGAMAALLLTASLLPRAAVKATCSLSARHGNQIGSWFIIQHACPLNCYRELVNYKGDKDPFKGDSLNQRVRDMAKEVISEVLYVSPPPPQQAASSMASGSSRVSNVWGGRGTSPPGRCSGDN